MEATVARELGGNQTAFKEKMGDNLVLERGIREKIYIT
jgi:hypothetical protein